MSLSPLERGLAEVLNRYSQENPSNTPDFILAQYLLGCLAAWNIGVQRREDWYGRGPQPVTPICVCGEPMAMGFVHRLDSPCFADMNFGAQPKVQP